MFTGIIERTGTVREVTRQGECKRMTIGAPGFLDRSKAGDSIAVDGVCLTVEKIIDDAFGVYIMGETLRASTMAAYEPGRAVNLEHAARFGDPIGGHIVQGHVDSVGTVLVRKKDKDVLFEISVESDLRQYLVPKGSIACDGISLTLADITRGGFIVSIIPFTLEHTNLGGKNKGDKINLEFDMNVKTIVSYMKAMQDQKQL